MDVIRIAKPDHLRPLHVFMLAIIVAAVAGGLWILSAAEQTALPEGAIEWHQESLLRAVVAILCLNYKFPTLFAGDVKVYILSLACGLSLLALSATLITQNLDSSDSNGLPLNGVPGKKKHISALAAAQLLGAMYVLWSFCSSRWSAAPDWALGGSLLIAIPFFWSLVIGNTLNKYAARIACGIVMALGTITACIAIWYYFGRKPDMRAEFPVGNPIFQAACLIPPILLALGTIVSRITNREGKWVASTIGAVASLILCGYAFLLCDSRGPILGLGAGVLAMIFFSLPKRKKWIPVLVACILVVFMWMRVSQQLEVGVGNSRASTVRFRVYAWDYAWRLFTQKPLQGHGQGGFTLHGDSFVSEDVLSDPSVFEFRIAHAHNEWLEILSDLGIVGGLLMAAFILMTIRAGMVTKQESKRSNERWLVIALLSAFVGMIVEESFSVGLRVSAVSTMFYSVIGLLWAISHRDRPPLFSYLAAQRWRQLVATGLAGTLGLLILILAQADFASARSSQQIEEALAKRDFDEAVRLTEKFTGRLNPQRALTDLLRVSRVHMLSAKFYQDRAFDRGNRAMQDGLKNNALLALADQDITQSEQHLLSSSRALKLLIERAPGYFNHGRIEYALNRIRADRAAAVGDRSAHDLAMTNATASLQRELKRQPYNQSIVLDYLHTAGTTISLQDTALTIAPLLRTKRMSADYLTILRDRLNTPEGLREWSELMQLTTESLHDSATATKDKSLSRWACELLRMDAAVSFVRGDYAKAQETLEHVTATYDDRPHMPSHAKAIGFAELAHCQFLNHPNQPKFAIESAKIALRAAENVNQAADLQESIHLQMIDYQLADHNEDAPRSWLKSVVGDGFTDEQLDVQIGARYRRLCQMLLSRREPRVLRKSVNDIIPNMIQWSRRAIELNPDDAQAYLVAADLSFHAGTCERTASYIRESLNRGIPPESAIQFLTMAADAKPECKFVTALRDEVIKFLDKSQQAQPTSPTKTPSVAPQNQ